jgi:hypothetical protein
MSLTEIEAALDKLTPDELRRLAVRSWSAFMAREGDADHFCDDDEDDPELLSALDRAVAKADASPAQGLAADEVRTRLDAWISR